MMEPAAHRLGMPAVRMLSRPVRPRRPASLCAASVHRRGYADNSFRRVTPFINTKSSKETLWPPQAEGAKEADPSTERQKDWSSKRYLTFKTERNRAAFDLASGIELPERARIVDLGCGPGNSTRILHEKFPTASILGMDSSPNMLEAARAENIPNTAFVEADLRSWLPKDASWPGQEESSAEGQQGSPPVDMYYSNAMLQWLRLPERLPAVVRLMRTLQPGGVFAYQVPDNRNEPSHALLRKLAYEDERFKPIFARFINKSTGEDRPDFDPIESPKEIYNALVPIGASIRIWHTHYHQTFDGPEKLVEWMMGTAMRPFLNVIADNDSAARLFISEYLRLVEEAYPKLDDGKMMVWYPRLFVVATKY